jgi:hypothetical protein
LLARCVAQRTVNKELLRCKKIIQELLRRNNSSAIVTFVMQLKCMAVGPGFTGVGSLGVSLRGCGLLKTNKQGNRCGTQDLQ